jgi:hypothetical protein
MGPITFNPGDMQELDIAFVFARDYTSNDTLGSIPKLQQMVDIVRNSFISNILPNGQSFNSADDKANPFDQTVRVYPNPACSKVTVNFPEPVHENMRITILNSSGMIISSSETTIHGNQEIVDISSFPDGIYFIRLQSKEFSQTRKLVIINR